MVFVSTSVVAISGVSPTESGLESALLNVGRHPGGSLGIAVLGTVAVTITKNQLANGSLTHAAINQAVTAGYSTAFEIASVVAFAGFLVTLATVRGRRRVSAPEADWVAA